MSRPTGGPWTPAFRGRAAARRRVPSARTRVRGTPSPCPSRPPARTRGARGPRPGRDVERARSARALGDRGGCGFHEEGVLAYRRLVAAEPDIVAAENRRLLRDVKELRARVAALESSRWWRLHPRFLLGRLRTDTGSRAAVAAPVEANTRRETPKSDDPRVARFQREIVARGSFRGDLVSGNFTIWEPYLQSLEGRNARILEIGSFEGMSACYFLWRLRDASVTCIDTFAGGASFAAVGADVSALEPAFDRNVALVDAGRVRKL